MTDRDPRQDPHAGDVLRKGDIRREVRDAKSGKVLCYDWLGQAGSRRDVRPTLNQFRKWATGAMVEKVGE